ncbi:putative ADP-ribosylation factor-like protein 3 [Trypanosoma cruzi]|uniref:ADP-ribosylation factor-like protein 3 n=3 Tax=Trypanosoma cruzi TaxID=5693 RepID=Q4D2I4_TRYCC|nr:ADP-ribosylation factor 3, putative [Trypanosoma cruzi]XP_818125.1 ADP-ribosylation factor 3, putative [Trypanosoma cruzi]PBJ72806.1 ADP-ribosylation factor-like protein 3 (arl3) [Trypanosoma cruzi cruzi]EAN86734.1 ADP-ribosylation factor 3, putative [Trypanosoma cruzi]EAN96274.1 ADP-ribosylation factor 3, putative [Trypanosoma cruzi]KAF8276498.1 putative ADP-ribosylation factor-like protein 3 [Trypanosoma cruzi]KAF8293141.1 putative ADP-ribosylation factor-like protein 3 [Trypanosoma cruz|eukprot:XP_808585.1 ADP-ribosylation factor 3 [Trypanosoma cruzi strain CL Brener]
MGLLTLLRKLKRNDTEPRILILGLDNAGKTSILRKLSDEDPTTTQATQGFNIKSINCEGFKLNMWDIGGQKAIRVYWPNYFDEVDCLIYVVDSADRRRLDETASELENLLQEEKLREVPFLVFANKCDLATALSPEDVSTALNLQSLRDRTWSIQKCSAKTGEGLHAGLEWAVKNLKK